jgi:hypothetical protein
LTFVGDGFLRHQLRRLTGALLAIGRGELHASFVASALATGLPCGGMLVASALATGLPCGGMLVAPAAAAATPVATTTVTATATAAAAVAAAGSPGDGLAAASAASGAVPAAPPVAISAYAASRLRGGGIPYAVAPGRGLWLERLVLIDEPLPHAGSDSSGGAAAVSLGSTAFWDDDEWCNNPTPGYCAEWGLRLVRE